MLLPQTRNSYPQSDRERLPFTAAYVIQRARPQSASNGIGLPLAEQLGNKNIS